MPPGSHVITQGFASRAIGRNGGRAVCHLRAPCAQAKWPTCPVQVMVPYAAGRRRRHHGRASSCRAGQHVGQQFVIENRGGAGGTIAEACGGQGSSRRLSPSCTTPPRFGQSALYAKLPSRLQQGFRHGRFGVAGAEPSGRDAVIPVNTMAEFIAYAKAVRRRASTWPLRGNGHMCSISRIELFRFMTGTKVNSRTLPRWPVAVERCHRRPGQIRSSPTDRRGRSA